jgi:uncharacterized protein YcfL
MKKLALLLPLFLAGCGTTTQLLTTKEQVVILPSESMYNCPTVGYFPKPETLTDLQVARLLVELQRNNKVCRNSIDSIKKYLIEAKDSIEKKS